MLGYLLGWRRAEQAEKVHSFFRGRLEGIGRESVPVEERGRLGWGRRIRTVFISDLHLGARSCRAELLLSFLRQHEPETLYLVGDVIDGWRLKRSWHWPKLHDEILSTILAMARRGCRVVYITGNHDDFLRPFCGKKASGVEVVDSIIHETADGRRFLVMHGDQLDDVIRSAPWLARLGDIAYDTMTALDVLYNGFAKFFGLKHRSIAAWSKSRVKRVVNFISSFETELAKMASLQEADGVVCGHIHHATIRALGDISYINTGDWVESCTAILENSRGELELLRFSRRGALQFDEGALIQRVGQNVASSGASM
ncbi:MAG: UDP-2,3-diacylglucosamine diphosphatase [Fretibacterium sp.]|nr:UDP-2,3-diacylglucosamine diphosphatase [Fretibacterium sp.]